MDKPGKPEYHEKGTIWLLAKSCLSIKKSESPLIKQQLISLVTII